MALCAVVLVSALLGIASWISSLTGGHERTTYWSKIFAGIAYCGLGLSGFLSLAYLDERQFLSGILSALFFLMGAWLLRTGMRLRSAASNS